MTASARVVERIGLSSAGFCGSGNSALACRTAPISSDGRYDVFYSTATDLFEGDVGGSWDIFVHDLALHTTTRVSLDMNGEEADGDSRLPSISADGPTSPSGRALPI
jgi:Tol biopolymer transport system component